MGLAQRPSVSGSRLWVSGLAPLSTTAHATGHIPAAGGPGRPGISLELDTVAVLLLFAMAVTILVVARAVRARGHATYGSRPGAGDDRRRRPRLDDPIVALLMNAPGTGSSGGSRRQPPDPPAWVRRLGDGGEQDPPGDEADEADLPGRRD